MKPMYAAFVLVCIFTVAASAQVSPEDHLKHHPDQAKGGAQAEGADKPEGGGGAGGMMGGGGGMGAGGGAGGGMGGMMEQMGAPKPKDLYPQLMDLPDLSLEERARFQEEAHQRMLDGTALLSEGLDELSDAAASDDFAAMQVATVKMREGLAQFESGLAAHRAIAEGKTPRNIALQWFKREMNLLPPVGAEPGFRFFGMTAFHTGIMVMLIVFFAVMIWMYFFKMRRAAALLETLTAAGQGAVTTSTASSGSAQPAAAQPSSARPGPAPDPPAAPAGPASSSAGDCCQDSAAACPSEDGASDRPDISRGLLRVAERQLCRLRVASINRETTDVKTFRLVACHGGALPFSYLPGQFLTLTLPAGEKPIRRSYTISSSPTQGYHCEISVKREDKGAGSRYLHDNVKEGQTLEVQAPSGRFTFTGQEADSVVLISGGVGITPMMSITRALTDMGWHGDIYFISACRDPEHFIFASELAVLQQRHPNLHVHVAMSRLDKDANGYRAGRLSKDMLAEWIPDITSKWVHLCGAPPMMDATRQMLAELGVPTGNIHVESFGSQQKPRAKAVERETTGTAAPAEAAATVTFLTSGASAQLLPDETILEASERVDVSIDNSCRVGMCGVCSVKLVSGQVAMESEDGLSPEDKAAGMVLACQAKSTHDLTVEA